MFPNQTPPTPTSTTASTSQTTTQAAATIPGAAGTNVTQAIVSVANTANLPVTTTTGAIRTQPAAQRARPHPYARQRAAALMAARALHPAASAAQGYQQAAGAAVGAAGSAIPAFGLLVGKTEGEIRAAHLSGASFNLQGNRSTSARNNLTAYFDALTFFTGLTWSGQYTGVQGQVNNGPVGRSSISALDLSFSDHAITNCNSAEISELMRRANDERIDLHRRSLLILKVLRAFSGTLTFWHGALTTLGILLGQNLHSVTPWSQSYPSMPTAAARQPHGAAGPAQLTLHLPISALSWDELLRFLQDQFPLQSVAAGAAAPLARGNSTAGLIFEDNFIRQQHVILADAMRSFNNETNDARRNFVFAKIIAALKERYQLPEGTFMHVCRWLGVNRGSVSSWVSNYRERALAPPVSQPVTHARAPQMHAQQTGAQATLAQPLAAPPLFVPATTSTTVTTTTLQPTMFAPVPQAMMQQMGLMRRPALRLPALPLFRPAATRTLQPPLAAPPQRMMPLAGWQPQPALPFFMPAATSTVATHTAMAPAVTATQAPQLWPMPVVPPAPPAVVPALPVFATPATTASTTTAQLAPVVQ
ncbi:MAG: hypothetical protein ACRC9R_02055, partial [Enterovibrio sp.]